VTHITFESTQEGRYERHRLISWWDQERLANARAVVAGAGALGNEVLKLLALLGFGHVLIVDFDTVSVSNLSRTVLFRDADVGRPKAAVAAERIRQINPQIDARAINGDLQFDVGLGEFRDADIVLGCLDSVNARWALNRKCMMAGALWIDAGMSDYHGHVTKYSPDAGPCYECTFTEATWDRFSRRYSCPYGLLNALPEVAMPSTAVTTSAIAALQVQEALLVLHGIRDCGLRPGERLTLYLKPYRMFTDVVQRNNPDCGAHETVPRSIPVVDLAYYDLTASGVIEIAEDLFHQELVLKLGFDLVDSLYCPQCDDREQVVLPKGKVHQHQLSCPRCHQPREPDFVNAIGREMHLASLQLRRLGIPPNDILAFTSPSSTVGAKSFLHVRDRGYCSTGVSSD